MLYSKVRILWYTLSDGSLAPMFLRPDFDVEALKRSPYVEARAVLAIRSYEIEDRTIPVLEQAEHSS